MFLRILHGAPQAAWDKPAITQTKRTEQIMGYSIRNERYRYTEWAGDRKELYDYESDPMEPKNLVNDPAHAKTVAEMARRLHSVVKP